MAKAATSQSPRARDPLPQASAGTPNMKRGLLQPTPTPAPGSPQAP